MNIRDAGHDDLSRILEITNDAIMTTAHWAVHPVTLASRREWLVDRKKRGYPVLVSHDESGRVIGFASFGDFRPWDAYRHTVEHSLYVDATARRQGIGSALLGALFERARLAGVHVMVAGIGADNTGSIRFHERMGFEEVGHLREVGQKLDQWLDLVFMQRFVGE